ncbi:MAG: type VI secretion system tube protein Hcp [Verrucomicrobiaceae bacterium]|nr:MAG: type VI secretion system tube protein Hcp [Verrucomicrobiaceae bacterium]
MKKLLLTALLVSCCLGTLVRAQSVTYFLDYEGIPGSTTMVGFENKIEVLSYSSGVGRAISTPTGASSNREASAPSVSELTVFIALDPKANMELTKAAFIGNGKTVKLKGVRAVGDGPPQLFMEIEMTDTMIAALSQEGSNGNQVYINLSLNFTKVKYTTIPFNPQTGQPGQPQIFTYNLTTAVGS